MYVPNILPSNSVVYTSVSVHGVTKLGFRSHPTGSSTPEDITMTFSFSRSDQPVYTTASLRPSSPCLATQAMAGPVLSYLWNSLDMSSSGHVCYSPQHASSTVYVSNSKASSTGDRCLSQDLQGRSMYMFPPFPLLNKVIQKLRTTQEGEVIQIPLWSLSQPWFPHLLRLCVDHTSFRTAGAYCHNRDMSRTVSRTICTHGGSHAALPSSRIFKRGL